MNKNVIVGVIILVIVLALGGFLMTKANNISSVNIIGGGSPKTLANYSLADVAIHNKATDCWMAISGKVYDVTAFIASGQHKPIIVNGCGLDATEMFSQIPKHEGSKAQSILPTLQIGLIK